MIFRWRQCEKPFDVKKLLYLLEEIVTQVKPVSGSEHVWEVDLSNLVLRKLEGLVPLTEADRNLFKENSSSVRRFNAHEDIVTDTETPSYANLILDGWACRYKNLPDGRRQILSFFIPGDMCNPLTFLLPQMTFSLASITAVKVLRFSCNDVNAMMAANSSIERAFWLDTLLSAEMQREWTVGLGRRSALERLAHLFCELALRQQAVGLSNGTECDMPITQIDIGDALGLSTVHVSRTLQELRSAHLVELKDRKLTILDERALRELAMFDPRYLHSPLTSNESAGLLHDK